MLSLLGRKQAFCDGMHRREFLRVGALGLGGVTLTDLLRLDSTSRALLFLVEVEGHGYADAGALLGLSEEAARARAFRARRQLRLQLREEIQEI